MQRKTAFTYLKERSGDDWLPGYESQSFFALAERVLKELRSRPHPDIPLTILLAEREPLVFLAHCIAACAANCHLVLANPDWVTAEWQQVFELIQPDLIWGEAATAEYRRQEAGGRRQEAGGRRQEEAEGRDQSSPTPHSPLPTPHSHSPTPHSPLPTPHSPTPHSPLPTPHSLSPTHLLIPTGGTSGKIRFAIHTWDTLMASIEGFCAYFEVKQVNAFCVLPLYHVSGLMQFLRSFTTGGKLVVMPFKTLAAGDRTVVNPEEFFLSLVPTQLQRLLDGDEVKEIVKREEADFTQNSTDLCQKRAADSSNFSPSKPIPAAPASPAFPLPSPWIAWLARFHTVLVGGAPAWSSLLDRARSHRIRLALTYGMTETASQIATLKPDDFLNGRTDAGQVLPHAHVTIRNPSGDILASHQIGSITIQSTSLAWGYYPSFSRDQTVSLLNTTLNSKDRSKNYQAALSTKADHASAAVWSPPQISCSGGLGELGPQKAGDRGEVPRTQSLNEAKKSVHRNLKESERIFQPDDLGFFDTDGYLHIVGRQSDKIITGGENVYPIEVEAAIRSTSLVQDVCVIGVPDRRWGQAITAVYVPIAIGTSATAIQNALSDKLSKFKRPKHWLAVDQLPRNAQGKVNRSHVAAIATDRLSSVLAID